MSEKMIDYNTFDANLVKLQTCEKIEAAAIEIDEPSVLKIDEFLKGWKPKYKNDGTKEVPSTRWEDSDRIEINKKNYDKLQYNNIIGQDDSQNVNEFVNE